VVNQGPAIVQHRVDLQYQALGRLLHTEGDAASAARTFRAILTGKLAIGLEFVLGLRNRLPPDFPQIAPSMPVDWVYSAGYARRQIRDRGNTSKREGNRHADYESS
jgi:hypothetical protein